MYKIEIINKTKNQHVVIKDINYADTFFKRLIGLMGKKEFNGLIFKQENSNRFLASIHTCFMRVPIILLYINKEMIVNETSIIKPWKLHIPKQNNTKYIIELPANTTNIHIKEGNKVVITHE